MASQSLTTGNNVSDLPLVPPPRSSSREPAPIIDASIAEDQPRESRRRDVSRGSKRSDRPQSSGVADTKAKRKKKGGFLSFLSCCSSETVDPDSSEPSKASASRSQPARSRVPPPPQQQQQQQQQQQTPQNISVTDTSGESNDVIDEKNEDTVTGAASTTAPEMSEKSLPSTHLQTTPIAPQVSVQAPTPVIAQSEEEQLISDRTPEQAQRDTDIEMTDAGPSIPLSTAEVPAPEDGPHESTRDSISRVDLPPPPPLAERQAQTTNSVAAAHAQETSIAFSEPSRKWLLPPLQADLKGRKCLVLDLDETLVHSSFKILHQADFTIPVEIEGQYHNVYVIKRPGVDKFLKRVGEIYEVVVFTASVSKYGDPLLDQLDISGSVHHRLFRESCYNHQGNYVKDLSQVGRPLEETIIIDNSPTSYIFHPQHAVPISSWFSDAHDNELLDLIPVLEDLAGEQVRDVSLVLDVAL